MDVKNLFLALVGILSSVHLLHIIPAQIESKVIVHALDNVLDRFYSPRTSTVFIVEQSSLTVTSGLKPIEVAGELIRMESNRTSMTYVIENYIPLKKTAYQRDFNIFIVDCYESFSRIMFEMTTDTINDFRYYTIVLTKYIVNYSEIVRRMLNDFWSLNIANVVVLTPGKDYKKVFLYTFFPYTPEHCEIVKPIVLDHFENGSFVNERSVPIFPEKFNNFHKCPLSVSTYNFTPFVFLMPQPNGSYYLDGIEGTIIRVLSQQLNFTVNVLLSRTNILKNITNSSTVENKKYKLPRSLELISNGSANFTVGATVVAESRARIYSMTFAHFYGSLIFAIPPGRPYTSFEKLSFPFKMRVWACICVLFLIAAIVIVILKLSSKEKRDFFFGKSNNMPIFNMVSHCFGGTTTFIAMPVRNFARTLLMIWLLTTLVLRNAYQGKLYDNLRGNQRMAPYFYIDDLFQSNLKLLSLYDYGGINFFWNLTDDDFGGAYMTITEVVDYFNLKNFPYVSVLKTKDYIQSMPLAFYFRKLYCCKMSPAILTSFFLVVLFSQLGNGALNEFQMDREIKFLARATSHIIRQFYSKRTSAISLIQPFTVQLQKHYKQSEIMNRILLHTKSTMCYVIEWPKYMKYLPFLRACAIIFIDSYAAFRHFYQEINVKSVHYAGYFTIILTEYIEKDEITQIFQDCWKYRMINVNVLCPDEIEDQVNVYTYFPFTPNSCDRIQSTLLMTFSNESISIDDSFFPMKLKNFHKCNLFLATYNIPPYMILNHHHTDGSYVTRGIEGNLYRELSKLLNFQPIVRVGHEHYLGGAKENFEMLRKGEVNLTMFAIVNTVERSKRFTASFPYAYTSVVFTTPHGPPLTPLEKLMLPFEPLVWACFLIATGAALSVTIYMTGRSKIWRDFVFGKKNHMPFLHFINITLGGVVTQPPVRNFARTIFMIWLLGSLVLRSSYQGALFSFIQSQKSAVEIESLEKLAEFNFTIYSSVQIIRLLQLGSPHLSANLRLHDGSFDILEELKKPQFHGAFVTTNDIIGYHNLLYFKTGTIRPSKQRIFLLPLSIFMEKHSCLESIINQQIELFTSNGLIEKWSNVYREKLIIARKRPRHQPKKLKLVEVSGAYIIMAYLYGVSLLLFIGEICSARVRYLRTLFDHV
ncbi:uncharacterized protein LOC129579433 [Sitodiplosis mosellana]|uniref:uncharacterized protein LOC129579433 n=1 Tax=Sitodiplosis mosellana TaxID=263140 RepID=UPI002443BF58|nr:uncharacterized protein LOC129579433 [Sitodiplosis mosellana]